MTKVRHHKPLPSFSTIHAIIICCLFLGSIAGAEEDYLPPDEVIAIGGSAIALSFLGTEVKKITPSDTPLINGPIFGEGPLLRWLGGSYTPGKSNFLDNDLGAAITPIIFGCLLSGANLSWPQRRSWKDTGNDLILYTGGLTITKSITDITKGIVRRPRPVKALHDDPQLNRAYSYSFLNTSFFSGHASSAFFSATYLNLRLRTIMRQRLTGNEYSSWRWTSPTVLFGWATYVGWTRIRAYKHYPSDVIFGAIVGLAMGEIMWVLAAEIDSHETPPPSAQPMFTIGFSF